MLHTEDERVRMLAAARDDRDARDGWACQKQEMARRNKYRNR